VLDVLIECWSVQGLGEVDFYFFRIFFVSWCRAGHTSDLSYLVTTNTSTFSKNRIEAFQSSAVKLSDNLVWRKTKVCRVRVARIQDSWLNYGGQSNSSDDHSGNGSVLKGIRRRISTGTTE
jgi:hypothetical protein